jgi:hypothetical protein
MQASSSVLLQRCPFESGNDGIRAPFRFFVQRAVKFRFLRASAAGDKARDLGLHSVPHIRHLLRAGAAQREKPRLHEWKAGLKFIG